MNLVFLTPTLKNGIQIISIIWWIQHLIANISKMFIGYMFIIEHIGNSSFFNPDT